jgi:hypothetical protein
MAKNNVSNYIPSTIIDEYKGSVDRFGFPSDNVSNKEKLSPSWIRKCAEAIFSCYLSNSALVGYNQVSDMLINRQYGAGLQSILKYRKQIEVDDSNADNSNVNPISGNGTDREGTLNINWDVISELPKLKRIFTGMVEGSIFDVSISAIDERAGLERESMMWDMWLKSKSLEIENEILALAGGSPSKDTYIPQDIEELKAYRDMGGIKLPVEIAFKKALTSVFYESNYDREVQVKLAEDVFENNIAAVKDYVDPYSQRVKTRYVDPTRYIGQYNRASMYEDSTFAGELIDMSIVDVSAQTGLSEEELMAIGANYNSYLNNTSITNTFNPNSTDLGMAPFTITWNNNASNYKVLVLDFEVLSKDYDVRLKKKDRTGVERYINDGKSGNVKVEKIRVYRGKWVVGTSVVFDYGYAYDIPYDKQKKRPRLSFHAFRIPGRSICQMLIPLADAYALNWYKFQNALIKAPPAGLAVEFQSLQNITLGGRKMKPSDVLKLRTQTGFHAYRSTNVFGRTNSNTALPFHELDGGIGRQFNEFLESFDLFQALMQRLSGFTDIAAAQSPQPREAVGNNQMAYAATTNALKPLFNALVVLKEKTAKNCVSRIQVVAKYNKEGYQGYMPTIGNSSMEAIKITADYSSYEMGLIIRVQNDIEQKQALEVALIEAMRPGKDGMPGLTISQYLFIKDMLANNNLELARVWLSHMESKTRGEADRRMKENMQLQGQENMKLENLKQKNEMARLQRESELKNDNLFYEYLFKHNAEETSSESRIIEKYADLILQRFASNTEALEGEEAQIAPEAAEAAQQIME